MYFKLQPFTLLVTPPARPVTMADRARLPLTPGALAVPARRRLPACSGRAPACLLAASRLRQRSASTRRGCWLAQRSFREVGAHRGVMQLHVQNDLAELVPPLDIAQRRLQKASDALCVALVGQNVVVSERSTRVSLLP